jgi:hypothetical protein
MHLDLVQVFSKAGASVVLADINETLGQKAAEEINQAGGSAHFVKQTFPSLTLWRIWSQQRWSNSAN